MNISEIKQAYNNGHSVYCGLGDVVCECEEWFVQRYNDGVKMPLEDAVCDGEKFSFVRNVL